MWWKNSPWDRGLKIFFFFFLFFLCYGYLSMTTFRLLTLTSQNSENLTFRNGVPGFNGWKPGLWIRIRIWIQSNLKITDPHVCPSLSPTVAHSDNQSLSHLLTQSASIFLSGLLSECLFDCNYLVQIALPFQKWVHKIFEKLEEKIPFNLTIKNRQSCTPPPMNIFSKQKRNSL